MLRPMTSLTPHLPMIAATFVLAGLVKGVTGLGLPTVGVGLLSLVMPPAQAASLVVVPSLVTNSGRWPPARRSARCSVACGRCRRAYAWAPGLAPAC